jgi:hypothetical protein
VPKSLLLKTDGTHRRVDLPKQETYKVIADLVAGGDSFDIVHDPEKRIRGYIHDSGLLLGLPVNPVASLLFGLNLVGDVIVTNPFSPKGVADGYDYDLEDKWFDGKTLLTFKQISADKEIIEALQEDIRNMDMSHHVYSLSDEQLGKYFETGEIPPDAKRVS